MTLSNRRVGLDLLRAIAILVVVQQHGSGISNFVNDKLFFLGLTDGVDLFFVLSGFLIGSILIKEIFRGDKIDIKRFWIRRWLRTLPNYYIALIVNLLLVIYVFQYEISFSDMFRHLAFIQNVIPPYTDFRFFSEAWSLSIEEFFYLTLPLIFLIFYGLTKSKTNLKSVFLGSLIVMIIFPILLRMLYFTKNSYSYEEWNTHFRIIVPFRLDSLAIGVLGAYLSFSFNEKWNSRKLKVALFILSLVFLFILDRTWIIKGTYGYGMFSCVFYFTLYSISILLAFPFLDSLVIPNKYISSGINYISKISYSMYLFHNSSIAQPFTKMAENMQHEHQRVLLYLLYWVLVMGIASLAYYLIEKPILKYRDKVFP